MKKKINKVAPYLIVLVAVFFAASLYLWISHQQMRTKTYFFNRTIAKRPKAQLLESVSVTLNSTKPHKREVEKLQFAIDFIALDSLCSLAAVVESDSMPIVPSGIYRYDRENRKVDVSNCLTEFNLPQKYMNIGQRMLAYDGMFYESENCVTFTFFHIPDIYVLSKKGKLITHLKTKDNVPAPSVTKYKEYEILERGSSYLTNATSFVIGEKLYVLSFLCPKRIGKYTVDCYDMGTKNYEYSFYVENDSEEDNTFVREIKVMGNVVTITTDKNKTTFRIIEGDSYPYG